MNRLLPHVVILLIVITVGALISNLEDARLFSKWSLTGASKLNRSGNDATRHASVFNHNCSCLKSTAPKKCCDRTLQRQHKFGWVLANRLFGIPPKEIALKKASVENFPEEGVRDYRHVVLVRNVHSAIVSGYLYHKSGHECSDKPIHKWTTATEWIKMLSHVERPFSTNLSLCAYLANASESDGIKAYADASLRIYRNNIPIWNEVQKRVKQDGEEKAIFVCMEDLSNPDTQLGTYEEVMKWFYPGGQNFTIPAQLLETERYQGNHATSHDPMLHSRLVALVKEHDLNVFDQQISHIQSLLKC